MKLCHTVIMLLIAISSVGQNYHKVISKDVFWETRYGHYDGLSFTFDYRHSVFQFDTLNEFLINKKYYSRLVVNSIKSTILFHEDTTLKHIYKFDLADSSLTLMYDFSLTVGDTFPLYFIHSRMDTAHMMVVKLDTQMYGGSMRKIIQFEQVANTGSAHFYETWIEGIGSSFGPLRIAGDGWHIMNELFCFNKKKRLEKSIYGQPCSPLGLDKHLSTKKVEVFPNPILGRVTLKCNSPINHYKILGSFGKVIDLPVEHVFPEEIIFDFENEKPGVYYIQIVTTEGYFTKKTIRL